jgi:hypothetical protein
MPFTTTQKEWFIAALQRRGWELRQDTVWSPSEGLYFNDAHFEHWTPAEMRLVFTGRANRIKEAALEGWQKSVDEHREVCSAAEEALTGKVG